MAALYRPVVPEDNPGTFSQERLLYIFYQLLGLCALVPNICLFTVLCYYKIYRRDYMDSWICAQSAFMCLRLIGNTAGPLFQVVIAIDRFICIRFMFWSQRFSHWRQPFLLAVVFFTCGSIIFVGLLLAYSQRGIPIATVCGRKAAFGQAFGEMIYCLLIFGYLVAVFINIMSYLVVSLNGISGSSSNVHKLKQAAAVSFMSFILISVPNISAILEANLPAVFMADSK
ncbi:hypothetical protein Y032_0069g331 [Ancylostoma ceylanicum]|uniref:G-protein coupled receptors family 1 profile domain-containing protein n=1 Tax=Ancylostoma ceylanicum TaxID=53326 RepID=A0A016TX88_9BILA|nr:hypothetical protein Y032_0069g331 [Ancylostoma ceylanicum]